MTILELKIRLTDAFNSTKEGYPNEVSDAPILSAFLKTTKTPATLEEMYKGTNLVFSSVRAGVTMTDNSIVKVNLSQESHKEISFHEFIETLDECMDKLPLNAEVSFHTNDNEIIFCSSVMGSVALGGDDSKADVVVLVTFLGKDDPLWRPLALDVAIKLNGGGLPNLSEM